MVHALEKIRPLDVAYAGIVEHYRRPDVQIIGKTPLQARLGLDLYPVHRALVRVLVAVDVAYAPEAALERIERYVVVQAALVMGKDVRSAYAYFIELPRCDVSVQGGVGGRQQRIGHVGAVYAGGNKAEAELCVGAVMGTA